MSKKLISKADLLNLANEMLKKHPEHKEGLLFVEAEQKGTILVLRPTMPNNEVKVEYLTITQEVCSKLSSEYVLA